MLFTQSKDAHDHPHSQHRHAAIPTSERLNSDPAFSGRGVTVAFLDSGFYPHPDIVDRVLAFYDVNGEEKSFAGVVEPLGHHWHGTQTVAACAGDGRLSDGMYRGLAHESSLVLVKASKGGRIDDTSIEKGLRWVIENRARFDIRILNISLGGDCDIGLAESRVNQLAETLIASGVVVTVAAGNSDSTRSIAPASSPSAITVGGYSDQNQFDQTEFDLYHSSFGATADGHVKPEMIAPAMYVAAPILPGTIDHRIAETLSILSVTPDYSFREQVERSYQDAGLDPSILGLSIDRARETIVAELESRKIIATHYQHVDGTSFAAPITASVVALMLQANPGLTPPLVKDILISTAIRLGGHPAIRQGFGILNARSAVELASKEGHSFDRGTYFPPRIERNEIIFRFHDDAAQKVTLCGDFNSWDRESIPFDKNGDGLWHASIPCRPSGAYRYKFLVDGARWTEDPSHGVKEDDGLGGFNSILTIA